jgi:uncharacterized protein (TIGR02246 family)
MDDDIRWLVARTRIRELTATYNRCFDAGDAEGFANTFVPDGALEIVGGPVIAGHEALRDMCRSTPRTVGHVTVNAVVTVDGDRATQRCTLLVLDRSSPPKLMATGSYDDDLVRTDEGWRFVRRVARLDGTPNTGA